MTSTEIARVRPARTPRRSGPRSTLTRSSGLGLGIALKIDDGAKRGAERALAELLAVLLPKARSALADQLDGEMLNWRGLSVGRVMASSELQQAVAALAATPRRRAKA